MNKVFQGLFLDAASQSVGQSAIISMGSANCAMFEVWLTSIAGTGMGTPQVVVTLEGSNDQLKWDDDLNPGALTVTLTVGPSYDKGICAEIIPYAYLRLTAIVSGTTDATALLDASIKTFSR